LLVAEFFAGIGLMRAGLESAGPFRVVWANDIEASKHAIYAANYPDDPAGHFRLGDVREIHADDLPDVDLATASFPCTDLSLAGGRRGLGGNESSMFWEFHRILAEMERQGRLPRAALLENVTGFATSRNGADLVDALAALNDLGYVCDVLALDAAWFVHQSRPRMFIVGALDPGGEDAGWEPCAVRPAWIRRFIGEHTRLKTAARSLPEPPTTPGGLADKLERLHHADGRWWEPERVDRFVDALSDVQRARLDELVASPGLVWRTAYRRTRGGRAMWEIRRDAIAGCLRTARGGSSKQALVEAGEGNLRIRWMTPREYARLQGADDYIIDGFRANEVYFGFGDAVCVPVIAWLTEHYLAPLLTGQDGCPVYGRGRAPEDRRAA
jgi:DNA (cytosine-5)-methyltransferase 1